MVNEAGRFLKANAPGMGVLGVAVCGILLLAVGVQGREELVENSPFVPEGFEDPERSEPEPEPAPEPEPRDEPLDSLQLRGITVMEQETRFSFYDPEGDEGFWLSVDESENGYTVIDFEEGSDSVRVRQGEYERSLTLHESEVGELSSEEMERMQSEQQQQQRREAVRTRNRERPAAVRTDEADASESVESSDDNLQRAARELRQRRALRGGGDDEAE